MQNDHFFGPLTEGRLNEVLSAAGKTASGICGPEAWDLLFEQFPRCILRNGSNGDAVMLLQLLLNFISEV